MKTASEIYGAFKSLGDAHGRLDQRFRAFFHEASGIWDPSQDARYNMVGATLTADLANDRFEITVCGRVLRFAFEVGITDNGQPRGIINCSTPDQRYPGSMYLVCAITFRANGDVDYPLKPADISDPLQIDDIVSAFYIVSYCIFAVLRVKAMPS